MHMPAPQPQTEPNPILSFSPENVWCPSGALSAATSPPGVAAQPPTSERASSSLLRAPCNVTYAMAPTAPSATTGAAAASPAAPGVDNKAAARSVRLGLPALPGLGLGVAAQGQTRAASFCNRMARNVVAMATGEPAAPPAANEELTEFVNALKQEWDRIEDKYAVTTLAVAATLGMWSAGGVVSAIDRLPLVPGLMEAVGLGYSGWFAYRNLLFKPDRDAFFAKVREVYEDIISG
ncbi:hypothetical protein U9M48_007851 [Paspalum notatum var. saurae]|uniref:Cyanobacterial aminoacyl-tRNA synthetase CAAD domain-containing protein n=1 Tax=Paspalum notatum var. saurae TaxID=547442 RepID=A0AAQ3SNA8_PASNO